jgi:hypothetical protein
LILTQLRPIPWQRLVAAAGRCSFALHVATLQEIIAGKEDRYSWLEAYHHRQKSLDLLYQRIHNF